MLVLQRYVNESLIIIVPPSSEPTRIKVMLTSVETRDRVRLGTKAPSGVEVWREEIAPKEQGAAK